MNMRLTSFMHQWGIPILRISLGIVFLWFGALKVLGVSPVTAIVATSYPLFPTSTFMTLLGVWEILIGVGLIGKIFLRVTLALLWLQMAGTLLALAQAPLIFFFSGNPFLLTVEGEFVVKNIVFIAASIVIGGYEISRKSEIRNLNFETNSNV